MSERTKTEILNEYLQVVAKVDKAGHSGYARRLMNLMEEFYNSTLDRRLQIANQQMKEAKAAKEAKQ